jgi:hypothetical protein
MWPSQSAELGTFDVRGPRGGVRHITVLIGLGTVWILDGLEVTIVAAVGSPSPRSRTLPR